MVDRPKFLGIVTALLLTSVACSATGEAATVLDTNIAVNQSSQALAANAAPKPNYEDKCYSLTPSILTHDKSTNGTQTQIFRENYYLQSPAYEFPVKLDGSPTCIYIFNAVPKSYIDNPRLGELTDDDYQTYLSFGSAIDKVMIYPVQETIEKKTVYFWYSAPKSSKPIEIGRTMLDSYLTFEEYQKLKKESLLKMDLIYLFNPENNLRYSIDSATSS